MNINKAIAAGVPLSTAEDIERYVEHGIPLGDFLSSVFQNDLFGAYAYADSTNSLAMKYIVMWIYNHCPASCHGTGTYYVDWLRNKQLERRNESQAASKVNIQTTKEDVRIK